jgi:hypothetical protein
MRVRREDESRPQAQAIEDRPQRRHTRPAIDQNIALRARDQETVPPDPPVAAGSVIRKRCGESCVTSNQES